MIQKYNPLNLFFFVQILVCCDPRKKLRGGTGIDGEQPFIRELPPIQPLTGGILARVCGVQVGWRLGSRLASTLVATKNYIIFSFLPLVYFSHRRSARIKKLI